MRILTPLILGAALISAGVATAAAPEANSKGEAQLAKILDGRVAGKPVDCINTRTIDSTEVVDGTAIVYHDGSRLYVNRPDIGRESLNNDDVLVTKLWSSDLCSIDTVRLFDRYSRFEHGFVGLGQFVPYTKPKPVPAPVS